MKHVRVAVEIELCAVSCDSICRVSRLDIELEYGVSGCTVVMRFPPLATDPAMLDELFFLRHNSKKASAMKAFKLIEAVRQIKSSALPEIKSLQLLAHAQTQFAREYRDRITSLVDCGPGSYTTHLLNALEDDFRVALLFWGPGSKSSIHDHGQTLGAVTPVVGVIHETQYEVLRIENRQASLAPLATIALDSSGTTPISPDTAKHAHCLANNSDAWVATIHVYLAPLTKFHAYQPDADGTFTMMEKTVRYERDNEWRRLEPNVGVRGVEQPRARSTVARPPRSLAAAL